VKTPEHIDEGALAIANLAFLDEQTGTMADNVMIAITAYVWALDNVKPVSDYLVAYPSLADWREYRATLE
jgi:hypothetical protein